MKRNLAVSSFSTELCNFSLTLSAKETQSRGLSLPGAEPFRDTQSQAARFVDKVLGEGVFQNSGAKSLWEIRNGVIAKDELARSVVFSSERIIVGMEQD